MRASASSCVFTVGLYGVCKVPGHLVAGVTLSL
jgi:hypothetical protein